MNESLLKLMALAERVQMSPEDRERQRRSFAYGSAKIENDGITEEDVQRAAERLARERNNADGGSLQ
jgi:Fic family protein